MQAERPCSPSQADADVERKPRAARQSRHRNRPERHSRLHARAVAIRRAPVRGCRGERKQEHGQSAAAPVLTTVPLGADRCRQGAAAVRAHCRADGGPARRLAAQRCAGAVQWRRCSSHRTDRSAGGCADWRPLVTTRARAFRGPDAAEASPRRCVSWRSRGRRWRGPSARATERPCRISAEQTGLLTAARPRVPGETARGQAMATGYSAWPAAGSASESGTASTLGQTAAAMTRPGHSDACANELSTRAGEKGVHERVNDCGSEGFGSLL
jgi:hypothetical protein